MDGSYILSFGKHRGKSVSQVYAIDKGYLEWCLTQSSMGYKYPRLIPSINYCKQTMVDIVPPVSAGDNSTDYIMPIGKHKGKSISDIYAIDKRYLEWCLSQPSMEQKYPQLIPAINYCKTTTTTTTTMTNTASSTHDVPINYDEYVDIPETIIKARMQNLGVSITSINNMFDELRIKGPNINASLMEFSNEYLFKEETNKDIDRLKICLAWKYGIINDKFRPKPINGTDSLQDFIIDSLAAKRSMNDIILELSRKRTPEEKLKDISTGSKYCEKLPFLFTPAMYQLLLLGMSKDDTKRIHKCHNDYVMGSVDFPIVVTNITKLYTFDWKGEYYRFITNPYAYYNIGLEMCDSVVTTTGRNLQNLSRERYLGQISRFVYDKTKHNKWTATPDWLMKKDFPDFVESKDKLRDDYGLIYDLELTYLKHIHIEEEEVASFISSNITLETTPLKVKYSSDYELTMEQREAVEGALSRSTSIITGLAGTGKTFVVKEIVKQIILANKTYIVCSFTAKAVKRVKEVLEDLSYKIDRDGKEICCVRTIHSLIHSIKNNMLDIPDFLIIDEATMVSLSLLAYLLRVLRRTDVTLIMLGDINQLPPIKYGRPFEDIVNSGCVDIYTLTKNLRVRGGVDDPIIVNSNNIVRSSMYEIQPADNFVVIDYRNNLQDLVLSNRIMVQDIKHHKFITATNADNIELNRCLSTLLNPNSQHKIISMSIRRNNITEYIEMKYSIGDPVIFTKNHVYKGVSNGCEGKIIGFSDERDSIIVHANKLDISVPIRLLKNTVNVFTVKNMMLAYSITVHKSQGSQWNNVYFYIKGSPSKGFLHKRLEYTAITRACEKCTVIEEPGLFTLCARQQIGIHYGGLSKRIDSSNNFISFGSGNLSSRNQVVADMINMLNIAPPTPGTIQLF